MKVLLNCMSRGTEPSEGPVFDPLTTTLIDRPFVQHVVEWLAHLGLVEIDILTDTRRRELVDRLSDGTRWGCRIRVRSMSTGQPIPLRALVEAESAPVLLARGDRLPVVDVAQHCPVRSSAQPVAFFTPGSRGSLPAWTGWAWLTSQSLRGTERLRTAAAWERWMYRRTVANDCQAMAPVVLSVVDAKSLLEAQNAALRGDVSGLQIGGREIAPGVRVARGVTLAPETRVTEPVFFGENSVIRASEIGPFAVIEDGAFVAEDTIVSGACVGSKTYVGPQLELRRCVAKGQTLYHVGFRENMTVGDASWLQDMTAPIWNGAGSA